MVTDRYFSVVAGRPLRSINGIVQQSLFVGEILVVRQEGAHETALDATRGSL
jgi:hypothetical protein